MHYFKDSQNSGILPYEIMVGKENITGGGKTIEMTEGGGFARYIELK